MNPIQWISFVTLSILIPLNIYVMRIKENEKNKFLPLLIWLVHSWIFYLVYAIYPEFIRGYFTEWGSILRLQGYLTIGLYLRYKILKYRDAIGCCHDH